MFRSNPVIDRFIKIFFLPACYYKIRKNKQCKKSAFTLASDLLELFFSYKTFPDNYNACRLWNVSKSNWKYYYGSNYQSYQKEKFQKIMPNEYRILFYDKVVCDRLCSATGVRLPCTYGVISPEQNYIEKIISWFSTHSKDILIVKPIRGSAGKNIILLKKVKDKIIVQSDTKLIPLQEFVLPGPAVVQEYIKQDKRMNVISRHSLNTLRIVTMLTRDESVIILAAYMRCGVGESYRDNVSTGGLGICVNRETGQLNKYAIDSGGKRYIEHPTSKAIFGDFVVPEWQMIMEAAKKTQRVFSFYPMLGLDLGLQENGEPVLIEVNAVPDLLHAETICEPLLKDKRIIKAFGEYNLLINKHQKELYENLLNE